MGYVRDDGKTMVAQPHLDLDPKKMWTLDHLRRMGPGAQPERDAQRDDRRATAFHADYIRGGPAGRPGPAKS
jgi:propane monooxygenase large subunit